MRVRHLFIHPCLHSLRRHPHATRDLDFGQLPALDEPPHGSGGYTECFRGLREREQQPLTIEPHTFTR